LGDTTGSDPGRVRIGDRVDMTPLGWVFLFCSMAFVWGLASWCYYQVLTGDRGERP